MASRDSVLARALMDAQLRYQPQLAALDSLLSQRRDEYTRGRRVAASTARGITASIDQTQPQVAAAFDQALASAAAQRGALGVGADDRKQPPIHVALGKPKGLALTNLLSQKQQAVAGQSFANSTARSEFFADKDKIQGQMQGLLGESGAYTTQRRGELEDKEADRGLRAGSLQETQRHNRAQESIAAQRAADAARKAAAAKKPRLANASAHDKARSQVDLAARWISRLSQSSMTSSQVRDLLGTGGTIDVGGNKIKVPQIDKDFVNSAYDVRDRGGLSKANIDALHRRRLSVKQLGYSTKAGKNKSAMRKPIQDLADTAGRAKLKPVK